VIIRGKTAELISSEPLFQRLSQEFSTFFRKLLDNSAAAATSRLSMKQLRPDDAELVAKAQAGDREAFAQLYDRHAAMVARWPVTMGRLPLSSRLWPVRARFDYRKWLASSMKCRSR
jgi:hypothetical protein